MRRAGIRGDAGQRGSVLIWTLLALVPLIGFAAIAVDTGLILVARTQLQGRVDAALLAAMRRIQSGGTPLEAQSEALAVADENDVVGSGASLDTIQFGDYNYKQERFKLQGRSGAPAVQITATRDVALFFGPLLGVADSKVHAQGVAATGCREIVLAQDATASWEGDFDEARIALESFVDTMRADALPGDKIGLAIFAANARRILPLRPLPAAANQLRVAINRLLEPCADFEFDTVLPGTPPGTCQGTDHAAAILEGMDQFDRSNSECGAERLIVLISDGPPCNPLGPGGTEDGARRAADQAAARGISIAPLMLLQNSGPPPDCPSSATSDAAFNASLARGVGQAQTTLDANDLGGLLDSITLRIPVRLVD